jgi:dTDP-4-amino-4,6-dideoxygalactose transaminase
LRDLKDFMLPTADGSLPLYYFPILLQEKESLLHHARKRHIELIAWPTRTPIYPLDNARDLLAYGYEPGRCPMAEDVAAKLVGLPTHSRITASDRRRIIDCLTRWKS